MSDERLQQLGIPRRRFLKSTAAAAFVAPVVVSFGLDGIAEAQPGTLLPNQCFANQTQANQLVTAENDLIQLISLAMAAVRQGQLHIGFATSVADKAMTAGFALVNHRLQDGCATIEALIAELQDNHTVTGRQLLHLAQQAQLFAGCACLPGGGT